MDFLNEFYRNDANAYEKKMPLLTPIGLPDEPSQERYLKNIGFQRKYNNQEIYKDVACFYNRHRFSQKNMDDYFVNFLQVIHRQYGFVGYIAPCIWPTKYHVEFSDEICLFNMSTLQYSGFTSYPNQIGGGQLRLVSIPSPKYVERNTWKNIEMLKNSGWTGEYEIDSDGILVSPSAWELGQFCKASYEKKKREEVALLKKQIKEREDQTRLTKKSEVASPQGASDGVQKTTKKSKDRNIKSPI